MCVIVYKPKSVLISEKVIRECYASNQDGTGFTIINDEGVFTRKGYMNIDDLLTALSKFKDDCECVIHFRISTSGVVNPVNCHPYPISKKSEDYTKINLDGLDVIYHNGIIVSKLTSWSNDIDLYSDTMLLSRDILAKSNMTGRDNILTLITNTSNNKFLTVTHRGKVTLYGNFHERDGVYYSNLYWTYKTVTTNTTTSTTSIEVGKGRNNYSYKSDFYCKKCKAWLYPYERNSEDGLCQTCQNTEVYKRIKNKKIKPLKSDRDNSRLYCPQCGVKLLSHEVSLCDDCTDFYTRYSSYVHSERED